MMRRSFLLLTIPLAAGLSACGVGPSKAAFASRADAACDPGNKSLAAGFKPADQPQLATAAGTLKTAVDGQLGQLRALEQPGGKTKVQIEALWSSMASLSQSTGALQQAASNKDDGAAAKAMNDTSARYQDGSAKATALGLTSCMIGMKPAVDQLSDGAKAIIKTSYIAKGEGICTEVRKVLTAIPQPSGKNLPAAARYLDRFVVTIEKLSGDLKAIPAPPGDEAVVAEMIGAQDASLAKFEELRDAALAKDAPKVISLEKEVNDLATLANAKLITYGLKTCGTL